MWAIPPFLPPRGAGGLLRLSGTIMKLDIDTFLQYLAKDKGYSQNTVAAYRNDLNQMSAFITIEQEKGIIKSYDELLKSYLLKLREKRYSAATTARKVA